jgi:hypothetical protein
LTLSLHTCCYSAIHPQNISPHHRHQHTLSHQHTKHYSTPSTAHFRLPFKRHTFLASSMDRAHMERAKGVETILSHALTAAYTSDLSFYKRRPPTQLVLGFFPATQYSIALSSAYDIPFWNLFLTFLYIYSSYLPLTTAMRPRLREADILSPPTHYSRLRFLLSSQISIPLL